MMEMDAGVARQMNKLKRKERYDSKQLAKYKKELLARYMSNEEYNKYVNAYKKVKKLVS